MITPRIRIFLPSRTPFATLVVTLVVLFTVAPHSARADQWALLIGIDSYKDSSRISSLGSAAADARGTKKALVECEGVPEANIRLLVSDADPSAPETEAKPERNAILRALSNLAKNVQPGDNVFVFFSGHGIEKNGVSYLLPYDTDAFDDNTITDTAIDTTKFRERLQAVHAGVLILAFDMCRNNPLKGSRGADNAGNILKASQVRGLDFTGIPSTVASSSSAADNGPHAVITLFSCSPDERSYEWTDKGRGYFSWFLEQGLRGTKDALGTDGAVHIDTLTRYISVQVPAAVKRDEGKPQTPFVEIKGRVEASGLALTHISGSPNSGQLPSSTDGASPRTEVMDRRAYLKLAVSPASATVSIDGVRQTVAAGRLAVDLAGEARKVVEVGVEATGFQPLVERVTLSRGTITPMAFALKPLPAVALDAKTLSPAPVARTTAQNVPLLPLDVVIDTSQIGARAPNAAAFAAAAPDRIRETFSKIVEVLGATPEETPSRVRFLISQSYPGVAETANGLTTISMGWISAHPDDLGLVVHEMTHVVQNYDRERVPGWLTEGMADYVRWYLFEPASKRYQPKRSTAKYTDSYQTSASFFDFIVRNYDVNLIRQLNRSCREGHYSPDIFNSLTGKSINQLSREWVATLEP